MTTLTITTRHLEVRRETRVLVDDDDQPISEPELVSICSCGAEIATAKDVRGGNGFRHDDRWSRHKYQAIGVIVSTAPRPGDPWEPWWERKR